MHKVFLIILFILFSLTKINAQVKGIIHIFIEKEDYDSLKTDIQIFFSEINKVKILNFDVSPLKEYKKDGMVFSKKISNSKYIIKDTRNIEAFHIKCSKKSIIINSSSTTGFKSALFYYLEKLGFYYYVPLPEWHIKPKRINFFLNYEEFVIPSFYSRDFFIGNGMGPESKAVDEFNYWKLMNNFAGSLKAETMHIYDDIILRNKTKFLSISNCINGQVNEKDIIESPTFNLLNNDCVNLVIKDSKLRIEEKIKTFGKCDMISMEPSDGDGFINANKEIINKIGRASNQAFWLANKVAEYNQKEHPNTLYGILAYNNHMLPPSFPINKKIYVEVANGFNFTEYSTDAILQMYKSRVSHLSFYEYLDVYDWTHDLPGLSVSSSSFKVEKNLKMAYSNGARYFNAESSSGLMTITFFTAMSAPLGIVLFSRLNNTFESNISLMQKKVNSILIQLFLLGTFITGVYFITIKYQILVIGELPGYAIDMFRIMAFSVPFLIIIGGIGNIFVIIDKLKEALIFSFVSLFFSLISYYIFIHYLQITGLSISFLIISIFNLLLLYLYFIFLLKGIIKETKKFNEFIRFNIFLYFITNWI